VARVRLALCLTTVAVLLAAASPAGAVDRYSLAGGCYALRSESAGAFVVKTADGGYRAAAPDAGSAEPFRMQATALGRYLLYGRARDFLSIGTQEAVPGLPLPVGTTERAQSAANPSPDANWRVSPSGGAFVLTLSGGRVLAVGDGGALVPRAPGATGAQTLFTFAPAGGCPEYPEAEIGATGEPSRGRYPFGEVSGLLDAHMHMMAFEFLGGRVHCGRPWHPYGVPYALRDCPDHYPNGAGAVGENTISYGNPAGTHDPVGWPTFKDWPHHESLTHEQTYYKWVERSWRGGLRLFVNLLVDNEVLCTAYPLKKNSCNEMDGVRLQARRMRELEAYIDAQNGGPGKGWFRIVTNPFEARRVMNEGKLAVVLGIEVSKLFDCGVFLEQPECDAAKIDRNLDEVYDLGVRDMELVNKFDNALAGVAGDNGTTGLAVNGGNFYESGKFWQMQSCDGAGHMHDRSQATLPGTPDRDALAGNLLARTLPPGATPVYGPPPHCNIRGLTPLGEYLINRMIAKQMIVDPDHLSVAARRSVLDILEAARYSGVISSHSWSTPDATPRIYALGGVVTPMAGSSAEFVQAWRETKPFARDDRYYFGMGWGADMNGFAHQGAPRNGRNPVTYPFKSFDGAVTLDRQRTGERAFDFNADGMAHYGLFPDWLEDARHLAGQEIVDDLSRGAEAYLQMWERAEGIGASDCKRARGKLKRKGFRNVRIGYDTESLLRAAGQPRRRPGRVWTYCLRRRGDHRAGKLKAVLSPTGRARVVVSTGPFHRARGVRVGAPVSALDGVARPYGRHVRAHRLRGGRRIAFVTRRGEVRAIAVALRHTSATPSRLRRHLKRAGVL